MQGATGRQFIVNMPGTWECRRTLQNVLRVLWLDVFERAGWTVASASNCEHGGLPPVPTIVGLQQLTPVDPKAPNSFEGECTNFVLHKQSTSTGIFAHGIDHREYPLTLRRNFLTHLPWLSDQRLGC